MEKETNDGILRIPSEQVYLGEIGLLLSRFLVREKYSRVVIVVDEHTGLECLPLIRPAIEATYRVVEIPAGEEYKTLETCQHVWRAFMEAGADRKSLCINLGGGVVGDLGGFCAATFMRGMPFVQIPTSVLAMADASVGGKLGVDFNFAKNYVGLFQRPRAVFIDPAFLSTLPARHVDNGMAEVLKHGLIADAAFFRQLSTMDHWTMTREDWIGILYHSTRIKSDIVSRDRLEHGERKKLNFGHTVGHAVESAFLEDDGDLLHGEAIFAGMIMEAFISSEIGRLGRDELRSVTSGLLKHHEKIELDRVDGEKIRRYILRDKKKQGDEVGYTLLDHIGIASIDHQVPDHLVSKAFSYYNGL